MVVQLSCLFGLIYLCDIDHGVDDGGDVLFEGLAVNQTTDCPNYLNFEVDLFLLLVVVRSRNDSHQQRDYQMQVVILGDALEFLDHLESLLPNMILF